MGEALKTISQDMVNKLKLDVTPHPNPYSMAKIKREEELKIDKKMYGDFFDGSNLL